MEGRKGRREGGREGRREGGKAAALELKKEYEGEALQVKTRDKGLLKHDRRQGLT